MTALFLLEDLTIDASMTRLGSQSASRTQIRMEISEHQLLDTSAFLLRDLDHGTGGDPQTM